MFNIIKYMIKFTLESSVSAGIENILSSCLASAIKKYQC